MELGERMVFTVIKRVISLLLAAELIANLVNFGCRFAFTATGNYPKDTNIPHP